MHPFNVLFSKTSYVSRQQTGKTSLNFNEARDDGVAAASAGKKVKASHTRYRALGPELIPVYRQSARR